MHGKLTCDPSAVMRAFAITFFSTLPVPDMAVPAKTFNWNILQAYRGKTPFLLSGGLRPGSLSSLLQFKHEQWAGIDLNSGFETAPALKDAAAVHTFINQLKQKIQ